MLQSVEPTLRGNTSLQAKSKGSPYTTQNRTWLMSINFHFYASFWADVLFFNAFPAKKQPSWTSPIFNMGETTRYLTISKRLSGAMVRTGISPAFWMSVALPLVVPWSHLVLQQKLQVLCFLIFFDFNLWKLCDKTHAKLNQFGKPWLAPCFSDKISWRKCLCQLHQWNHLTQGLGGVDDVGKGEVFLALHDFF